MLQTLIYSIIIFSAYVFVLIYRLKHKHTNGLGIYLISIYVFISLMALILIDSELMYIPQLTIFPYLLLLFSYFCVLSPFITRNSFNINNFQYKQLRFYVFIGVVYIVFSVVTVIIYLPHVINLISIGNWKENINLLYTNQLQTIYNNNLEWFIINFVGYFRLLSIIIFFVLSTNQNKFKLLRFLLFMSIILTTLFSAIFISSRGILFEFILIFFAVFLIFFQRIPPKVKRPFYFLMLILGMVLIYYVVSVTLDRFGDEGSSNNLINGLNSIIIYFGHAPITFNYGVFTITSNSYGVASLGELLNLFGMNLVFSQLSMGGSWGSGFYTYAGLIYMDFGTIGLIIFSILLGILLRKLLNRRIYTISTIYLVVIFFSYLIRGSYVIGRGYIIEFMVQFFIFILIYGVEHKKNILHWTR